MTSKKAFDLSRDSVYVADPIEDLCIIGGKGILPTEESGSQDTEPADDMPVPDLRRLKTALTAEFKANVAHFGVKVPIIIAKIDDMAVVLAGKRRVRALRAANRERKKRGEPLFKVRCTMQRDTSRAAVLSTIVTENSGRQDDDLFDRIEKAKTMVDAGMSEEDIARSFSVKQTTLRGWLVFDDTATDETKRAVREGRLQASSAAELAKITDPAKQNEALTTMLMAPEPRAKSARAAKALRRAKADMKTASDRKTQQMLLAYVVDMSHSKNASQQTLGFWEGVEETLKLVLGECENERLLKALTDAREAATKKE